MIGASILLCDAVTPGHDGGDARDETDATTVETVTIASKFTGYDEIRDRYRGFLRATGRAEMRPEIADDVVTVTVRFLDEEGNPLVAAPATDTEYRDEHLEFAAEVDTRAAVVARTARARAELELQG